jgi:hypothetical protein
MHNTSWQALRMIDETPCILAIQQHWVSAGLCGGVTTMMSRLLSDFLILIGIILSVRLAAEANVEFGGLWHAVTAMTLPSLNFSVDIPSLCLGAVAGLFIGFLATVRWTQVPGRTAAWFSANSPRLSYLGLSVGFAVVLLYY